MFFYRKCRGIEKEEKRRRKIDEKRYNHPEFLGIIYKQDRRVLDLLV